MNSFESKTKKILEYLKEHKTITSMEAFSLFHATRLSGIIFNLRKKGHIISSTLKDGIDNEGRYYRYSIYTYETPEEYFEKNSNHIPTI